MPLRCRALQEILSRHAKPREFISRHRPSRRVRLELDDERPRSTIARCPPRCSQTRLSPLPCFRGDITYNEGIASRTVFAVSVSAMKSSCRLALNDRHSRVGDRLGRASSNAIAGYRSQKEFALREAAGDSFCVSTPTNAWTPIASRDRAARKPVFPQHAGLEMPTLLPLLRRFLRHGRHTGSVGSDSSIADAVNGAERFTSTWMSRLDRAVARCARTLCYRSLIIRSQSSTPCG